MEESGQHQPTDNESQLLVEQLPTELPSKELSENSDSEEGDCEDSAVFPAVESLPPDDLEWADGSNQYIYEARRKQVPKLCETRWSARLSTLSSMIAK